MLKKVIYSNTSTVQALPAFTVLEDGNVVSEAFACQSKEDLSFSPLSEFHVQRAVFQLWSRL